MIKSSARRRRNGWRPAPCTPGSMTASCKAAQATSSPRQSPRCSTPSPDQRHTRLRQYGNPTTPRRRRERRATRQCDLSRQSDGSEMMAALSGQFRRHAGGDREGGQGAQERVQIQSRLVPKKNPERALKTAALSAGAREGNETRLQRSGEANWNAAITARHLRDSKLQVARISVQQLVDGVRTETSARPGSRSRRFRGRPSSCRRSVRELVDRCCSSVRCRPQNTCADRNMQRLDLQLLSGGEYGASEHLSLQPSRQIAAGGLCAAGVPPKMIEAGAVRRPGQGRLDKAKSALPAWSRIVESQQPSAAGIERARVSANSIRHAKACQATGDQARGLGQRGGSAARRT